MKWQRKTTRVYGDGQSYNCTNIATAKQLQSTLNGYETKIENLYELMEIDKQLKIITMDMQVLKHDLDNIKNRLEAIQ